VPHSASIEAMVRRAFLANRGTIPEQNIQVIASDWTPASQSALVPDDDARESALAHPTLFPLSWLAARLLASDGTSSAWASEFEQKTKLSTSAVYPYTSIALQALLERSAQRFDLGETGEVSVAKGLCDKVGCTVAESGICLLSHAAPETQCPHFKVGVTVGETANAPTVPATTGRAPLIPSASDAARRFHTGLELGTEDALEITRSRYAHLIGVLGSYDAGKTCFLLSLYLMASRGVLPANYAFAGSLTLKGFEDRARKLREWKGGPLPSQLVDHTSLADPRQPGLLHLGIRQRTGDRKRYDLLLTDLPGEWSKTLVDRADTAPRFAFLQRADGIVLVVDGPSLVSPQRHSVMERTGLLMERLTASVKIDKSTPIVILLSKCDEIDMNRPALVDDLVRIGSQLGLAPRAVMSAAFSRKPAVQNGIGVFDPIEHILNPTPQAAQSRSRALPYSESDREFAMFGSRAS